ncbi:hypothetical protein BOX37_28055 [Nocardia mangyaensis]|jgi:aminoglycoside phosphotransferase (APT) family kinase protein|uniref:Aminoglycoside phosphotransferase domain-containing protein n=1 Tax=Nocardia mangyaensis TaxID=2213200 RepID=A0A1J0VYI0_9NOCA|nr:aminoglycoside phosphotransferase family protein [Nocardia mangyaensis]APE37144.1 hypothetical protein BOX37_28055 [Nocardia mangyaensis]MBC7299351.1 aminoglycoside phosphotransferase family protein [Nocardia sp.]
MTKSANPTPPATAEQSWAHTILRTACDSVGLDSHGAHLIKFTNNAVFQLAKDPFVVRIAGSQAVNARATKVVQVARWFAKQEVPAVRLVDSLPQPHTIDKHAVTFWHTVASIRGAPAPNGQDLGKILSCIHQLPRTELPMWDPFTEIQRRLDQQSILAVDELAFLRDECAELFSAVGELDYALPGGLIHGDAFVGNLVQGRGDPVICDFDSTCIGPREWDLTPVAVGALRFTYPENYHNQLVHTYGWDVTRWSGFATLRRLRELQLVTSVLPVLDMNPSLKEQWQWRFSSYRHRDMSARWQPYQ